MTVVPSWPHLGWLPAPGLHLRRLLPLPPSLPPHCLNPNWPPDICNNWPRGGRVWTGGVYRLQRLKYIQVLFQTGLVASGGLVQPIWEISLILGLPPTSTKQFYICYYYKSYLKTIQIAGGEIGREKKWQKNQSYSRHLLTNCHPIISPLKMCPNRRP